MSGFREDREQLPAKLHVHLGHDTTYRHDGEAVADLRGSNPLSAVPLAVGAGLAYAALAVVFAIIGAKVLFVLAVVLTAGFAYEVVRFSIAHRQFEA